MKNDSNSTGFTLIELLVVISIVSLLSEVILQNVGKARMLARNARRLQDVDQIAKGFQIATTDTNLFPYVGTWKCLGRGNTLCWTRSIPGMSGDSALDAILSDGMSGGKIPLDPIFVSGTGLGTGQNGGEYLYTSKWPALAPDGAYLRWIMEKTGTVSCGRGEVISTNWFIDTGRMGILCNLYLGPPTLNP